MMLPTSLSGHDLHSEPAKTTVPSPTVTFAVPMVKVETLMGPWIVDTMGSRLDRIGRKKVYTVGLGLESRCVKVCDLYT